MLYLEIWIREGDKFFGCLKLNECTKDEICYRNYKFLEKTLKNYYNCIRSLVYDKNKLRWTFAQRCSPDNTYSWGGLPGCRHVAYHFETSGQSLVTKPAEIVQ